MVASQSDIRKIAILGKANSGKNTTAELLAEQLGYPLYSTRAFSLQTRVMAFADPIKGMVLQMFPWAEYDCLYGASSLRSQEIPNAKDRDGQPLTYRRALIELGTLGRTYDPDHWVKVFDHQLQNILHNPWSLYSTRLIICPDLRFPNELTYLKANNFTIIKVIRNSIAKIDDVSETSQDSIPDTAVDFILDNNGTLEDLQANIRVVIQQLL